MDNEDGFDNSTTVGGLFGESDFTRFSKEMREVKVWKESNVLGNKLDFGIKLRKAPPTDVDTIKQECV